MPKIIFVQPCGTRREVEATQGNSIMEAALKHGVTGITAECNGSAACATCHAYFEDDRLSQLGAIEAHEEDMLDFTASERLPVSRLSCQVTVTDAMDGMIVRLPESQ
ncbi:2Fe-2S iron-sulfur cluster-binding protein [Pelagibius sp. Alg239-R121]|uniref:2Fe-2S iron-sulfur cluster-binding protein n=1 Tax=Pelagibius sp. Alg239-R121 TaxID=2993448 RepID=UPI0024A7081C|nr:2Fe-2S iron-sulfur cluster-binding protein [Pelagibius sp. Alg239-R121]